MRLHLSPISPGNTYSSFNSQLIPSVKHSSILKLRNSPEKIEAKNYEKNTRIIKPFMKNNDINHPVKKYQLDELDEKINKDSKHHKIEKRPFLNNEIISKRKISDPKIDIPTKESQDNFFSIGEKIESNDQNTEDFFKKEPEFILRITRKATDVLSDWDFGYLDLFICEILERQKQIDELENECAIFIPIEMSKTSKKPFEEDDILIVESPFHLIDHTDPPLLITPVIYHSPENWRSQR